ncbi:MAG TPA: cupredoxin domain-containing protein [Actinomycetota bacterium]|jgi:plastocyanin|nr:cupredoxin domain-containing protein [Actinomycetota bacterium]
MRKALLVLTAVAALLPACGGDDDGGTTAATGDTAAETGATGATAETGATGDASGDCVDLTGEGDVFTVTIADFTFDPSCFTASASQGITVVNEDDVGHTFTMVGTDINVPIAGGETFNGEPIAGVVEPGTYEFVCTIHPQMTGEATVVA